MSERRLVDLVYAGAMTEAVRRAASLTPEEIRRQILVDDLQHLHDEGPCDEFIRAWFASLESPYMRAEASECFTSAYTTELAPVPNGEFIGAYLRTFARREVIKRVAETILGPEFVDLEETPEHPLSPELAEKWRAVGRLLAELDLPPAVPPVAPDEERPTG